MTIYEKAEIASKLDQYSSLFRAFWDYGNIKIIEGADAPQPSFSEGYLLIKWGREHYQQAAEEDKVFQLCRLLLKLLYGHFGLNKPDKEALLVATDLEVNQRLITHFGFDWAKLKENYHWVNTVFTKKVSPDLPWLRYYEMLEKPQPQKKDTTSGKSEIMDGGNGLGESTSPQDFDEQACLHFLEQVLQSTEVEEAEAKALGISCSDQQNITAGTQSGYKIQIKLKKPKKKKKWESVIKHWEKVKKVQLTKTIERWDQKERKYYHILEKADYFLPSDIESDTTGLKKSKLTVLFYLDSSGSCIHLKDRFFMAARSLDPKIFEVRLFTFDTSVSEVDIKSGNIYGGGGTSFSIIEESIQSQKLKKYPTVWVITDGYGDHVSPEKPDKWYWFLTPQHSKNCIPKASKVYNLANFE